MNRNNKIERTFENENRKDRKEEFHTHRTPHRSCHHKYHLKRKSIVIKRRNNLYINNLDIKQFQFLLFSLKSSKKVRYAQFSRVWQSIVAKLP